jgi:hypothetical protein
MMLQCEFPESFDSFLAFLQHKSPKRHLICFFKYVYLSAWATELKRFPSRFSQPFHSLIIQFTKSHQGGQTHHDIHPSSNLLPDIPNFLIVTAIYQ